MKDDKILKEKSDGVEKISQSDQPMSKRTYKTKLYALQKFFNKNSFFDQEKTIVSKSLVSSLPNSPKLYETISKIRFKVANTDLHLKQLKCECKIHPTAPPELTMTDEKTLRVNCKLLFNLQPPRNVFLLK